MNELIDGKEIKLSKEVSKRIEKMEERLVDLPNILKKSNEMFLYKYTTALVGDIDLSKIRYENLIKGRSNPKFNSKVDKFILNHNQTKQKRPNDYEPGFDTNDSKKNHLYDIIKKKKKSSDSNNDPFHNFNNVYYNNSDKSENEELDDQMDHLEADLDLLNMKTLTEGKDPLENERKNEKSMKFGPSPIQQFDLNLLANNNALPITQNSTLNQGLKSNQKIGFDPNQPKSTQEFQFKPQNLISFHKPELEKIKKEEIKYDPFSNIDKGLFD